MDILPSVNIDNHFESHNELQQLIEHDFIEIKYQENSKITLIIKSRQLSVQKVLFKLPNTIWSKVYELKFQI